MPWELFWSAYDRQQRGVTWDNWDNWWGSLLQQKRDKSGLEYKRNRYYDPQTGRFTQEDPIGLAGGVNLYGFAGGDPVNFSDPFGLCPKSLAGGFGSLECIFDDFMAGASKTASRLVKAFLNRLETSAENSMACLRDAACAGASFAGGIGTGGGGARFLGLASRIERHHQLPRAFRKQFERAGLDIEQFKVDLPSGTHRLKPGGLHTGPNNWNRQWKEFFEQNESPTRHQILDQLDRMRTNFGLD